MALLGLVGSRAYGTYNENSDYDVLGVCVSPIHRVFGLAKWSMTDVSESQDIPGQQTIHELEKFCALALNGNPTVLELLYTGEAFWGFSDAGRELRENRKWFSSQRALNAFLGYMQQQRDRLMGIRGQKDVNRKELVEKYGFDTKYAGHIIRLGMEGVEFASTGALQLPLPPYQQARILAIRNGQVPLQEVLDEALELEADLHRLRKSGVIPEEPQKEKVNHWMLNTYREHWG